MIDTRRHLMSLSASALLAGFMATGTAAPALAQAEAPPQEAPAPAAQISEEHLKTFANATREVNRIADKARTQLQEPGPPDKAQAVQQQAQAEMVEAVKKNGLSVEQYNQIAMAAQSDPKLREKVLQHMQQAPAE